jgi:hypothetical protein
VILVWLKHIKKECSQVYRIECAISQFSSSFEI